MTHDDAYDKIDRFLRNNLNDEDYADYSDALDTVYGAPPRMGEYKRLQELVTSQGIRLMEYESVQEPVAWFDKELNTVRWKDGLRNCDLADQQPLYTAPQPCPNCASLEAQNTELDRRLAEIETKCRQPRSKDASM